MAKTFYITTTLPYVNSDPHVGFALEIIRADIIARYKKLTGFDVFFNTGTDEHGQKIYTRALEEGKDPQKYVDEWAEKFKGLIPLLGISPDIHFVRTTDAHHKDSAQEFWRRCDANGDIYKKNYKIKYCVGCELEKQESELVDGKCPIHPNKELEIREEENYFFRWSKYQDKLLELYRENPKLVIPDFRFNEIKAFVERGLQDFSISRLKTKMPWGIPVPGDEDHVMYVWFDALVNYISTLGWPTTSPPTPLLAKERGGTEENLFEKFWVNGTPVQYAGKDNLRQQSAMWQAMLLSAGLTPTHNIVINGFINSGGQKMSKSLGNVISPYDVVREYGTDALRYYVARELSTFEDSDMTMEKFKEAYNANLANGLGNLVSRVMQLAEKNLPGPVFSSGVKFELRYDDIITSAFNQFDIKKVIDLIWSNVPVIEQNVGLIPELNSAMNSNVYVVGGISSIASIDQSIQNNKPWSILDQDKRNESIKSEVIKLMHLAKGIEPFMPETSRKICEAILSNKKPENLFPRKD